MGGHVKLHRVFAIALTMIALSCAACSNDIESKTDANVSPANASDQPMIFSDFIGVKVGSVTVLPIENKVDSGIRSGHMLISLQVKMSDDDSMTNSIIIESQEPNMFLRDQDNNATSRTVALNVGGDALCTSITMPCDTNASFEIMLLQDDVVTLPDASDAIELEEHRDEFNRMMSEADGRKIQVILERANGSTQAIDLNLRSIVDGEDFYTHCLRGEALFSLENATV